MRKVGRVAAGLWLAAGGPIFAAGVTPYLPLNLEPEIESQIERVLILGDQPVLTRPIAAATVLKALPKACKKDPVLCEKVERYLARYTRHSGVTHASIEVAHGTGVNDTLPDSYGMGSKSTWEASAEAYWQPSDYVLAEVGGVGYEGRTNFTGSMLSVGGSYAQIDLGFRPHWWSPLSDSSMLMSSEAPTLPSITLSNYEPISPLGIKYEFFGARMTQQPIAFEQVNGTTKFVEGKPDLFGAHVSIEPASGWSLGFSRLLQYGGAGRPSSLKDLFDGFFNPSKYDNANTSASSFNGQFGNQEASFTSSFLFPGKVPFVFYAEYAGEDTSRSRNYLLGNSALSVGIHFPKLFERFDLTIETSEWQNEWYTHAVYAYGMSSDGFVDGNWGADQRQFRGSIGAHGGTMKLGWDATFGGRLELRYRVLQNQNYSDFDAVQYSRYHEFSLDYSRPWNGMVLGGELDAGKDSFGGSFTRVAAFVRYDDLRAGSMFNSQGGGASYADEDNKGEIFGSVGYNIYRVRTDLTDEPLRTTGPREGGYHFEVGARRAVSDHNDLGSRLEFDDIDGHSLIGVRLVDYRYRFWGPLAADAFFGAARFALGTPAYGYFYGVGLEWRNVLPHLDVGVDFRYDDSIARDHLLPSDPHVNRPDSFYDIWGGIFRLSYHF
jgi:Capsule assembly protein Wzi